MRVGFEVSALRQTRAGAARYIDGLVGRLEASPQIELERLWFGRSSRLTTVTRDAAWYPLGLPLAAARRRLDVLHCPTFRAPLRSRVPLVETVHDLAVLRHPSFFNRWSRTYGRLVVPAAIRAARKVIAVSQFTKLELVELLDIDPARVEVIGIPPTAEFQPGGPAAEGDYVLAVGTVEPRKNLPRLVEAARDADLTLRVVGAPGWGRVDLGAPGVEWLGPLGDQELARQYRGALCFAYPSLYEGFGIPVLEAMACGTPVVTSAGGATEEVAGGAAELVDPTDPQAIAVGIANAVANRAELRERGLRRARDFDWDDVVTRTIKVYEEAAP